MEKGAQHFKASGCMPTFWHAAAPGEHYVSVLHQFPPCCPRHVRAAGPDFRTNRPDCALHTRHISRTYAGNLSGSQLLNKRNSNRYKVTKLVGHSFRRHKRAYICKQQRTIPIKNHCVIAETGIVNTLAFRLWTHAHRAEWGRSRTKTGPKRDQNGIKTGIPKTAKKKTSFSENGEKNVVFRKRWKNAFFGKRCFFIPGDILTLLSLIHIC